MKNGLTRRDALKSIGALAGAAAVGPRVLTGCGGSDGPGEINTIVVLMMENRSYDHYLGARKLLESKGGDGLVAGMSNVDLGGATQAIFREPMECVVDPPHGWDASRAQLAGGSCAGFVKAYQERQGADVAPHVMGYMTREELPATWALADAYTSCDRWFSSVLGPTWPNRLYLHGAQSQGMKVNEVPAEGRYSFPLIYDRLNEKGIDWRYYFGDLPFLAIFDHPYLTADKMKRIDLGFFDEARNGTLPPVVMIDPAFTRNDDHPPHHPILGQQLIASIYAALAASPQWKNLLFVITYDEHGGFFDHVAPPTAPDERAADGFDQLGFRVPAMLAGPYVKPGHVSSTQYNHTSVLKHIETMFGLAPLTMRDAAASDFSDAIDADRLAAGDARAAVKLPAVVVDESMIDPASCYGVHDKPGELITAFDSGLLPREWDHRAGVRDLVYAIGDELERLDAGRIRRGR